MSVQPLNKLITSLCLHWIIDFYLKLYEYLKLFESIGDEHENILYVMFSIWSQ